MGQEQFPGICQRRDIEAKPRTILYLVYRSVIVEVTISLGGTSLPQLQGLTPTGQIVMQNFYALSNLQWTFEVQKKKKEEEEKKKKKKT
nr:unnamed protein product [Spirometra erinaceieuropaei]